MTASFKSPGQHAGRALFPTSFAISNGEGSDCLPPLQSTFNNKETGERIYIYISDTIIRIYKITKLWK